MIQGGDPTGTGMGGESIYGEKSEAESNKAYQKANAGIYLQARNEKLTHYNDKYKTKLKASFRDEIASELSSLEKVQILDGGI